MLVGLPVTLVATVWDGFKETVDVGCALAVACVMSAGVPIGKMTAGKLRPDILRAIIAACLLGVSLYMVVQVVLGWCSRD